MIVHFQSTVSQVWDTPAERVICKEYAIYMLKCTVPEGSHTLLLPEKTTHKVRSKVSGVPKFLELWQIKSYN